MTFQIALTGDFQKDGKTVYMELLILRSSIGLPSKKNGMLLVFNQIQ